MGGYLSILNDTPDPWMCAIGLGEVSMKRASYTMTTIAATAAHSVSIGSTALLGLSISPDDAISISGMPPSALVPTTSGVAPIAQFATITTTSSAFSLAFAKGIHDFLTKNGYELLPVGQTKVWGKMSTSAWRQAVCVKTIITNPTTIDIETMSMNPIYSGDMVYSIQSWLSERETEKQEVVADTDEPEPEDDDIEVYMPRRLPQ